MADNGSTTANDDSGRQRQYEDDSSSGDSDDESSDDSTYIREELAAKRERALAKAPGKIMELKAGERIQYMIWNPSNGVGESIVLSVDPTAPFPLKLSNPQDNARFQIDDLVMSSDLFVLPSVGDQDTYLPVGCYDLIHSRVA